MMQFMVDASLHCWALDTLHVIDYNGIASHAISNSLVSIIRNNELPGCDTQAASLSFLNQSLALYYKSNLTTDRIGVFSV